MLISVVIPSLPCDHETNEDLAEEIRSSCHCEVEVLVEETPGTFAQNVNRGLSKVKGDVILVSNNDVVFLPGWSQYLERVCKENVIASMTPRPDCGWAWGMNRHVLSTIGLLDENLINSYDDYDYFIRAALHGFERWFADRPYMVHEGGRSLEMVWGRLEEQTAKRLNQCNKNRDYMLAKWPGVEIDGVPTMRWALNGVNLMRGYNRDREISTSACKGQP